MVERLRAWWQPIKKPLKVFGIVVVGVLVVGLFVAIIGGYLFDWDWTGIPPYNSTSHFKTLWDWLQLLIVPAVLAVGGFVINLTISRTEREIATDRRREDALQSYIDKISELMLRENLQEAEHEGVELTIVRAWTLTVLPRLDARRKGSVFQFLYDAHLVSLINLREIDLNNAILPYARLHDVFLDGAQLRKACLFGADLSNANLYATDLSEANLRGANLSGTILGLADLSGADLRGAIGTIPEQLSEAKSLNGATMPDGTKHL
jgi:hypothetical protein